MQNIEDIPDGRAACRSNNADPARELRERALARLVEKSFRFQLPFKSLELGLQQAEAARLQDLHVESGTARALRKR